MLARLLRPLTSLTLGATLTGLLALTGCQAFLDNQYGDSVAPVQGTVKIQGLSKSVSIRRNALGMPLIESVISFLSSTGSTYPCLIALNTSA